MSANLLDDSARYARLDASAIGISLDGFPIQCGESLHLGETMMLPPRRDYDAIVFCGVGGSAIGADFLCNALADRCTLPLTVVRDYRLPQYVTSATLVILSSYSGETEETRACYTQAAAIGATTVIIGSGGTLMAKGKQDGATCCTVPGGYQPRMAMLYLSLPILIMLRRVDLAHYDDADFDALFAELARARKSCHVAAPRDDNPAKKMAAAIEGKVPLIWGSVGLTDVAAKSWKNQINENAKSMAWYHTVPEANHNEITGFTNPGHAPEDIALIFLRDENEPPEIARRFEAAATLLRPEVGCLEEHWSSGKTPLSRMAQQIYFGNYISYYLAILYGVDPADIAPITRLKRMISL